MCINEYHDYLRVRERDYMFILIAKMMEVPVKVVRKIYKFLD